MRMLQDRMNSMRFFDKLIPWQQGIPLLFITFSSFSFMLLITSNSPKFLFPNPQASILLIWFPSRPTTLTPRNRIRRAWCCSATSLSATCTSWNTLTLLRSCRRESKVAKVRHPWTVQYVGPINKGSFVTSVIWNWLVFCLCAPRQILSLFLSSWHHGWDVKLKDYRHSESSLSCPPPSPIRSWLSGVGKMAPNSAESKTTKDGVVIPSGKWIKQPGTEDSSLLYNEFIVYEVGQVNIKYLLKLKFNYKY